MTFFTRETQVAECESPKNRRPSSPATFILRPLSAPGERIWLLFLQEIHKWSTKTLWNMEERLIQEIEAALHISELEDN